MNRVWQKKPEVLSSKIDGEIVLMSIESGLYLSLDPVGSRVWELLSEKPATVEQLADRLMEEFDVDRKTCTDDVQSFIDEMAFKGLVSEVKD